MAKRKPKKPKTNAVVDHYLRPTEEREAHNDFESAGMARKLVPVIDTLRKADKLSPDEWAKLAYYRDQASLADRSPLKSCIDFTPTGGGGNGPGIAILSASREAGRMECQMGNLWRIARAVAVDDMSLSQWCVRQHGGRERGSSIAPVAEKRVLPLALLELRMAAHRITIGG